MTHSAKRELSGFFLSEEKFAAHCAALADPSCPTTAVRLFHNEPKHTAALLSALASSTSHVSALDIYELDPECATQLGAYIASAPQLMSLTLHHMDGPRAVTALCQGLATSGSLTHLDISQLDSQGVASLGGALTAWQSPARLCHLTLRKSSLADAAAVGVLAGALVRQADTLRRLELVECTSGEDALSALLGEQGLRALYLEHLDMSSTRVSPAAAKELGELLAGSRSLHSLHLASCSLQDAGAAELSGGLTANGTLAKLDLTSNGIGASGATAVAQALQANTSLQELRLSSNTVCMAGLAALLGALSSTPPCGLRELHLDNNEIRGGDLPAAAAHMPQQQPLITAPLERLLLNDNALSDAGTQLLCAALSHDQSVLHLDLRGNGVGDASAPALLALLAAHPGLQGLLLDHNRLHTVGAKALLDGVLTHGSLWCFRLDHNKVTDPALRASLTQLSQERAARHSQEVLVGRRYSSDDSRDAPLREKGPPRGRGGGGGGSAPGAAPPRPGGQQPQQPAPSGSGTVAPPDPQHASKHRREGDDAGADADHEGHGHGGRNVVRRSYDVCYNGGGGGDLCRSSCDLGQGLASPMDIDSGHHHGHWERTDRTSGGGASVCCGSDDGAVPADPARSAPGCGGPASPLAMCYVTMAGQSHGSGGGSEYGKHRTPSRMDGMGPRRLRYKPLTAEQQMLFADF